MADMSLVLDGDDEGRPVQPAMRRALMRAGVLSVGMRWAHYE
jgi:hypothetical protein